MSSDETRREPEVRLESKSQEAQAESATLEPGEHKVAVDIAAAESDEEIQEQLVAELDDLALNHQRVWVLYTSFLPPALQEPLDQWVQARGEVFVQMPIKAPSTLAYGDLVATDGETSLQDRIAVLEELALGPAGQHGKWVRHSILADAYKALGDLYESQGDSDQASEYWSRAEETRAAAPPPW